MSDTIEKSEFPKQKSSSSGSDTGWTVEVRMAGYADPIQLCGQLITNKWKKFNITTGQIPETALVTIPTRRSFGGVLEHHNLLPYAAAQALRWALHAHHQVECLHGLNLETRLIKHTCTYEFTSTAVSAKVHIHGEDRSSILPNWGKVKDPPVSSQPAFGM